MRRFPFSTQLHEGKCVMWERIKAAPVITGAVFAIIGIILAVGGAQLVQLGYTLYYLLAGLGLIASGVLFALGRREGYWLYAFVFVATLIWALAEVGFDGWKLMPRVLAPAVLLLWVSMPWVTRRSEEHTSELQSLMRISYAVFCLTKKK